MPRRFRRPRRGEETVRAGADTDLASRAAGRARLRFAVVFGVLGLGLLGIYHYPYADGPFSRVVIVSYFEAYARAAGAVIRLFDPAVTVSGIRSAGRFSMTIVRS